MQIADSMKALQFREILNPRVCLSLQCDTPVPAFAAGQQYKALICIDSLDLNGPILG
jgi:hypothetical protein